MTSNQRDEVLHLLKEKLPGNVGGISYEGRHGDFFLFRRTVNGIFRQLCLKERSVLIVYYGDEYASVRQWADHNLSQVLAKTPCFKGWQLEIGASKPIGDKAVGFRLRNDTLATKASSWYCNKETVTTVAVELFRVLDNAGMLA